MIRERIFAILGAALLVAACGSGAPTAAPGQTTGAGPTTAATAPGDEPTNEPGATPGGAPSEAKACDLLTADEVEGATGYPDIAVDPVADDATDALSACAYVTAGVLPVTMVTILDPTNTSTDPTGYLALPGSEEVSISGARAFWVPAAGNLMFVIKGGTVVSLLVTPQQGEVKTAAAALAQKAADRV